MLLLRGAHVPAHARRHLQVLVGQLERVQRGRRREPIVLEVLPHAVAMYMHQCERRKRAQPQYHKDDRSPNAIEQGAVTESVRTAVGGKTQDDHD
eukprot:4686874-Pleurochrysis_carterae.AAC.1